MILYLEQKRLLLLIEEGLLEHGVNILEPLMTEGVLLTRKLIMHGMKWY